MKSSFLLTILFSLITKITFGQILIGATEGGEMQFGSLVTLPVGGSSISGVVPFEGFEGTNHLLGAPVEAGGKLYGLIYQGGCNGKGLLYQYDPATNEYYTKFKFDKVNGQNPRGSLILAPNGKLYGTTADGGTIGYGVIFEYDFVNDVFTKKIELDSSEGRYPNDLYVLNGRIYGTTSYGGVNNGGTIYEYDYILNSINVLFNFDSVSGVAPTLSLVAALNGKLYGSTNGYGANGYGTIFEFDPQTSTCICKVNLNSNCYSTNGMTEGSAGKLYGLSYSGGPGTGICGCIYEYDYIQDVFTVKHDFNYNEGCRPAGLFVKVNNKMYGLTSSEGAYSQGTLIEYNYQTDTCITKHNFMYPNGSSPLGTLCYASNGKLYGITSNGGNENSLGAGVLFEYNPSNASFQKRVTIGLGFNGSEPGDLVQASNGKVYGITKFGGDHNGGVIFEYNYQTNSKTVLHHFVYTTGMYPRGGLMQASDGLLYGTTVNGGANGFGVIYCYDIVTGVYTVRAAFTYSSGYNLYGALSETTNGKLYALTYQGGSSGNGTIAEFDINTNNLTEKFDFNSSTGYSPKGSLMKSSSGKFFGLTTEGATYGQGSLFEYDPITQILSVRHSFFGQNGNYPCGKLVESSNGHFFGMTNMGGVNDAGIIFEYIDSSSQCIKRFDFDAVSGYYPTGSLLKASNGKLYGMTNYGGNDEGVIFEFDDQSYNYTKLVDLDCQTGNQPEGSLIEINLTTGTDVLQLPKVSDDLNVNLVSGNELEVIFFSNTKNEKFTMLLYDMTGRVVLKRSGMINNGVNTNYINISGLDKAMYLVSVQTDTKIATTKVLVK